MTLRQHEVIRELERIRGWNDYARSLCAQFTKHGKLTSNQLAAAEAMLAKVKRNQEIRAVKPLTSRRRWL